MRDFRFVGRLLLAAVAVALIALIAGCGQNPLVGKWTTTTHGISQEMQFNSDGKWSANMMNGKAVFSGTYKTNNGSLTMYQTSRTLNGISVPATGQTSAPHTVNYQINGNMLSMTDNGRTVDFTREQ